MFPSVLFVKSLCSSQGRSVGVDDLEAGEHYDEGQDREDELEICREVQARAPLRPNFPNRPGKILKIALRVIREILILNVPSCVVREITNRFHE